MKSRAVIFDYNGTIVDDYKTNEEAWNRLMDTNGKGEGFHYIEWWGVPNLVTLRHFFKDDHTEEEIQKLSELKEVYYRESAAADPQYKPMPGAVELFEALKHQGVPFTIASASILENMEFYWRKCELGKWFDWDKVVYDDGTFTEKKQMYVKAAEVLGVPLKECAIIDDSVSGLSGARSLNPCRVIGILSGPSNNNDLKKTFTDKWGMDFRNITTEDL